jgi:hypothetical protein
MVPRVSFFLLLALGMAAGCSGNRHPTPRPGTGDVAFRLSWEGESDLDLMVRDPDGACISFFERHAPSGGLLDVDCNGSYKSQCDHPIENIFWPRLKAPAGEYMVWVQAHAIVPGGSSIGLRLQLLHGRKVFWQQAGALQQNDAYFGPFLYRFPGDGAAAQFPGPELPQPCGEFRFQLPANESGAGGEGGTGTGAPPAAGSR